MQAEWWHRTNLVASHLLVGLVGMVNTAHRVWFASSEIRQIKLSPSHVLGTNRLQMFVSRIL
jgi:hypothetical protein